MFIKTYAYLHILIKKGEKGKLNLENIARGYLFIYLFIYLLELAYLSQLWMVRFGVIKQSREWIKWNFKMSQIPECLALGLHVSWCCLA